MEIGFKELHPVSAFLFFLCAFCVTICFSHPVLLFISFFSALIFDIRLHRKKAVKGFFCFLLPVIILITAVNFAFCHYGVTTLFESQSGNRFTLEALVYGFVFGAKASTVLLWLNCFNEIISSDKFIFLFGRLSPKIALVISMVLRFIPLFGAQAKEIEEARKGLGIDSKSGNFSVRLKNSLHSVSILITWALENAINTSDSMSARGYGLHGRTSYNNYVFSRCDLAFSLFGCLSFLGLLIFRANFDASYNPVIEITAPALSGIITAIIFALFGILPTIYDIWEERLWSI